MTWIETIPEGAAVGPLDNLYRAIKGPNGKVDHILKAHSLRPHSLKGHMELYKNVLHHSGNELPKWFLEYLGVWVSWLNHCSYCVDHHRAGLNRLQKMKNAAINYGRPLQMASLSTVCKRTNVRPWIMPKP